MAKAMPSNNSDNRNNNYNMNNGIKDNTIHNNGSRTEGSHCWATVTPGHAGCSPLKENTTDRKTWTCPYPFFVQTRG
jgi:hypothetical protein